MRGKVAHPSPSDYHAATTCGPAVVTCWPWGLADDIKPPGSARLLGIIMPVLLLEAILCKKKRKLR